MCSQSRKYGLLFDAGKAGKRMVLRKKKSVGSMEDLWDESCFEENAANLGASGVDLSTSTRTIKISFGREGEGTVLKIPAKIEDLGTPVTPEESTTEKVRRSKSNMFIFLNHPSLIYLTNSSSVPLFSFGI